MSEVIAAGRSAVVTCSALRRVYRDLLREGRPEVVLCHLAANPGLIGERMGRRVNHYLPASCLQSPLAALEPLEPDEPGAEVSVDGDAQVVARALAAPDLGPPLNTPPTPPRGTHPSERNRA